MNEVAATEIVRWVLRRWVLHLSHYLGAGNTDDFDHGRL